MAHLRFQFSLTTLLFVMLAIGCFFGGYLSNRRQVIELESWIWYYKDLLKEQQDEFDDLTIGRQRADQVHARMAAKEKSNAEQYQRNLATARKWWGSVVILAIWFILIAIGWVVVIRRTSLKRNAK